MLNFNFNANDYEEKSFEVLPVGDYRVRIASAEEKTSKAGNPMVELKFDVSGKNSKLFFYIVIDQSSADKAKQTNQRLGEFYECFGVPMGNLDPRTWVGKIGACRVKHEPYNGEETAKQITFTDAETDRDYVLEFNRATVRQMEANGFDITKASEKPLTFLTDLFAGAFKMHHRFVKADVIDKLQSRFADKDKLIQRLIEMYSETLESLSNNEGDEGKENLIVWNTND